MNVVCQLLRKANREARPLVMGVVNITPDSFSDGGKFLQNDAAWKQIQTLAKEGADLIDIGGESTRPGADPVAASEQIARVMEPIRRAVDAGIIVSIDTTLAEVAEAAVQAGAQIINDVSCLRDLSLAQIAKSHQAILIVMHSRGSMSTMPGFSHYPEGGYRDVVAEVRQTLAEVCEKAMNVGLAREQLWIDPGLGFHKSAEHSYTLVRELRSLVDLGFPVVVGASRKSFLTKDIDSTVDRRLGGGIVAHLLAAQHGASVVRVHDVLETRQAWAVAQRLMKAGG
jgi:dihydropteroate synthase